MRKLALAGLLIMAAAGAWLVAAPFVLHYQPSGARWTGAARMDMAVGVVVAAAGLAAFSAPSPGEYASCMRPRPAVPRPEPAKPADLPASRRRG